MAKDQITLTQRRIANFKYFVYACLAIAIVADAAVFIVLAAYQVPVKYWIIPMLLTLADVAFLAACLFLNFRFKYSTPYLVGYALTVVLLAGAMFLIGSDFGGGSAYTLYAHALWPALHAVIALAVIVAAVLSAKNGSKPKLAGVVVCIALIACSGGYGVFALNSGYFGQGTIDENRLLLFSLSDDGESYRVVGVESGRGNRVVVPKSFDGKPVSAVDCTAFAAPGVSVVRLDCSRDIVFENESALDEVSASTRYITAKDDLDYFRNKFYAAGHNLTAKCMEPGNLAADEVYVTFDYDDDYLDIGKEYLPTWFGKKGDTLKLAADAAPEWYIYSKTTDASDLHLAYTARDRKIFYGFFDGAENRNNTVVSVSHQNVRVAFTDVYKVTIGQDNDDVYESPNAYKNTVIDGTTLPYRYTIADNADALVAAIPARNGFDVAWNYAGKNNPSEELETLREVLEYSDVRLSEADSKANSVTVYPKWTLRAPVMTDITAKTAPTYGDEVTFSSIVTSPANNIELKYEWRRDSVVLDGLESSSFTNDCIDIDEGGFYTLTATAYSEGKAVTSLTSSETKFIMVNVQKRTLHFDWSEFDNDVYDGTDKALTATHRDADVVTMHGVKDTIDYTVSDSTLKAAGTTTVTVELTGDCKDKYALDVTGRHSYTIKKRPLTISVNNEIEKVYDNVLFNPETDSKFAYTVDGLVSGESLGDPTYTVVGQSVNVGSYVVQVNFPDAMNMLRNYDVTKNNGTAKITERPISFTWGVSTFTYNGHAQHPIVTADASGGDTGIAPGDSDSVGNYISYVGGNNADADDYEVEIVINNGNYKFVNGQKTTQTYTIEPKPVTLTWQDEDEDGGYYYTYTGAKYTHGPIVTKIPELVDADKSKNISLFVTETGRESQASDTPYTITASLNTTGAAKNYTLDPTAVTTQQYYINKHHIQAVWNNNRSTTFTYNGDTQSIYVTGFISAVYPNGNVNGDIVRTETAEILSAITYGDTNSRKDVGTQTATATLSHNNYTLKPLLYAGPFGSEPADASTATLTIEQKAVTVTAQNALKIYDGVPYTQADLSYTHTGLVAADIAKLTATYNSTAIGDKNVVTNAPLTVVLTDKPGEDVIKNYDVTYTPGTVNIIPASLVIEWNTNSFIYNASVQCPTATISAATPPVSGDTVGITYSGDTDKKNVGSYTVIAAPDDPNYTIREINNSHAMWNYTIQRATVSIAWTETAPYTYNGTPQGALPTVTVDQGTITDFYEVTYVGTDNEYHNTLGIRPTDAGAYKVTVTLTDISNLQHAAGTVVQKTFVIGKKEINITWSDYTGAYDGAEHKATVATVTGAITASDEQALKDTLNNSRTGSRTNADDTAVTTTSLNHKNYALSASAPSGNVTINKALITIAWTDYEGVYDGHPHMAIIADVIGAISTADAQSLKTTLSGHRTGTRTNADDTGVTTTSLTHRNYALDPNSPSGNITITKKTVDITWTPYINEYDGDSHMATVATVTGAANAYDEQALLTALNNSRTGSRTNFSDETKTTTTSLNHRNYVLSDEAPSGQIVIYQRSIVLVWNDYVGEYDGAPHMAEVVDITNVIEKDKAELLNVLNENRTGSRTNVDDVATTRTSFSVPNGNYQIVSASPNGNVTITPAILSVVWKSNGAVVTSLDITEGDAYALTVEGSVSGVPLTVRYVGTGDTEYAESATAPTAPGTYTATVSTDNGNYSIAAADATISITITAAEPEPDIEPNGEEA